MCSHVISAFEPLGFRSDFIRVEVRTQSGSNFEYDAERSSSRFNSIEFTHTHSYSSQMDHNEQSSLIRGNGKLLKDAPLL